MQLKTRYLESMVERLVGEQEYDYDQVLRLGTRVTQLEAKASSVAQQYRWLRGQMSPRLIRGRSNPPSRAMGLASMFCCWTCDRTGHLKAQCYGLPLLPMGQYRMHNGYRGRYLTQVPGCQRYQVRDSGGWRLA